MRERMQLAAKRESEMLARISWERKLIGLLKGSFDLRERVLILIQPIGRRFVQFRGDPRDGFDSLRINFVSLRIN